MYAGQFFHQCLEALEMWFYRQILRIWLTEQVRNKENLWKPRTRRKEAKRKQENLLGEFNTHNLRRKLFFLIFLTTEIKQIKVEYKTLLYNLRVVLKRSPSKT